MRSRWRSTGRRCGCGCGGRERVSLAFGRLSHGELVIDLASIVRAVQAALPDAAPFAVVPMLTAQLPHVDTAAGLALLDRIVTHIPAAAWYFRDAELDRWPEPVAQHALACIRALPPGKDRILALCLVPRRLTHAEQREAFEGILDGTLPEGTGEFAKPLSYRDVIDRFLRTVPEAWQEEWIATKAKTADVEREAFARLRLRCCPEAAMRRIWSRIDHDSTLSSDVPGSYFSLAPHLPPDLEALALARIRACTSESSRLHHLRLFDGELTDAERCAVVEVIGNEHTRHEPHFWADHLESVATHLPKVPVELRRKWLHKLLDCPADDYDLQRALMALLPSLSGEDHRQAADALVASVIREARFYTVETRWDLLPDDALGPLLLRLRVDPYGWSRGQLVTHLVEGRDPALADRCLQPLLDRLHDLDADHCIETVHALTPWLADRSDGAVPRALAALPVPVPHRPPDPLYVIERQFARSEPPDDVPS
jgi:hypothetical protein